MSDNNNQQQQPETFTIEIIAEGMKPYVDALVEQIHKSEALLPQIEQLQERVEEGTIALNGVFLDRKAVSLIHEALTAKYTEETTRIQKIKEGLAAPAPEKKEEGEFFIVTKAHNLDSIGSTVYLTNAPSKSEAIIQCMEYAYDEFPVEYDEDEKVYKEKCAAELARLRSLSLRDLGQLKREGRGDVWSADTFTMPALDGRNKVVCIASLDSD